MRKSLRPLIILSVLLASSACIRRAKNSEVQEAPSGRWYAAERDVPPLELNYHKVLTPLPQGAEMLKRLCFGFDPQRSQDFDKVRQVFCQATVPTVTSLRDLQSALGLAIPEATVGGREVNGKPGVTPGWALTGHSTSLVSRFVSPINPRVILFTAPQDASTPSPDFVVMGFVRGDQFVEVIARDPKAGRLNFFLIAFTQACNATGHCSTGHLQSSAIEKDWLSISIYEDTYLANTVFDCTHCHQPEGPSTEKILRLQEMEQPWLHFFRDDTQGQELIQAFKDFHGPDEGVGGVPASLIAASDPEKLVWLLKANGFGEQPSHLPAGTVGADATWLEGWQRYVQGESIPFPSWANNILDSSKLPDIKARMDAAKAAGTWDDRPDLRLALDDRLSASYGARAPLDATGKELVALACQRCHNEKLDSNLGKSLFRADLKPSARSAFQAKNAIDRLNILRKDPSDPLAMPPRQFMDLTDAEIDLIIEELKDGRDL
ncbi:c-type cytochrome [Oligoflexus tunisiensis]|uniref:c-type cytochrome n=1 Tax=Oligoflexus tunisiensis TaxID=708132 RepID=UPI00159F1B64|nr:cytochrome c [Oligoflexus tunisiensis]